MIFNPMDMEFKHTESKKTLKICSVTFEDVTTVSSIFGPHLSGLRGKTVITKLDQVETDVVQIPRDIYKLKMFVN